LSSIQKLVSSQWEGLRVDIAAMHPQLFRGALSFIKFLARRASPALIALTWSIASSAWATGGYVYEGVGEVSLGVGKNATHRVVKNDAIPSDSVVNTGAKSYAVLKFEDGQVVGMQANTAFHVREYRYDPESPEKSNIVFSKFSGGMRFITGLIGQHNHKAFRLSTPNATIGINGTEFMVVTVNDTLYSRVISGSISMTNQAGMAVFTVGQTVLVESPSTLPVVVPEAALPPGIFSQLQAIPMPTASDMPAAPLPSAARASVNGETYSVDLLCDFCTRRTPAMVTHTVEDTAAKDSVTGEASIFGLHNLTPSGANTGEICAFCHTPQGSESSAGSPPVWNRTASPSGYRAYSSLGSAAAEATGSISMACLSCHDGSQAPNIVINTPSNNLNIPVGEQVNIGNTLKNHHPVGMPYAGGGQNQNAPDIPTDPLPAYNKLAEFNRYTSVGNKFTYFNRRGLVNTNDDAAFNDVGSFSKVGTFNKEDFNKSTYSGTGTSTVWWIETPNSRKGRQKTDLYLFTRTDTIDSIPSESTINQPYVECATCHDPHSVNSTFLRQPGGNARSQVCLTCHNK
jgi:predicted CXXCH cytochrome family protein